jgi:alkylated DNA nucleotide flippase Atl1
MVAAVETSLQKLLEGTKQYQVPLYQRAYSWKNAQFDRLWEDLLKLAEDRAERGQSATHFIGSLVLAPSPTIAPTGLQEFLVVDGQQRLTTLSLLLAAIRDQRAESEDPNHFARVNEKYLVNKWEDGKPLKLLPTQIDRDSYSACVHGSPSAGGGDAIGSAYRFFRGKLAEIQVNDEGLRVQDLEEAVIAGLSIVCVTAQAGDNVHRIFESLNNTGLRLTQADLLRNYLFMRLPTRGEHVYKAVWLPLEAKLKSEELELLFWLDLVQTDETAKQTDTYSLQQARLDRLSSEDQIEAEVVRFAGLGSLLATLLNPELEPDGAVRLHLKRLGDWKTTTAYPLLMHLLDRREKGSSKSDEIAEAMLVLESFLVRRLVIGKPTSNLNRVLMRSVIELQGSANVADALRNYLSTGRKFFASDAEVRAAVRTVPFYWSGRANQKRLVLEWIEDSYEFTDTTLREGLTIEHVLPQTTTEAWMQMIAADLEPGEDIEAVVQSLLHTIGNLTLTGYNSNLGNSPFEQKQVTLGKSGLRINTEIASCRTWDRTQIFLRADRLAERIISIWPAPNAGSQNGTETAVWENLNQILAAVPAGMWASYGDIAALLGTHPVPLGQRLTNHPTINAHRVLSTDGTVAKNFRWLDSSRTESAQDALEHEGIVFDDAGRANPDQRLSADDLAVLSGLDDSLPDLPSASVASSEGKEQSFWAQVESAQSAETMSALRVIVNAWSHLGGWVAFGAGEETSCFMMAQSGTTRIWPVAIYPSGKVEVVFQYLADRAPFDDLALRHQLREGLNEIEGVNLSASRIQLRPGFQLNVLDSKANQDKFIEQLGWFMKELPSA